MTRDTYREGLFREEDKTPAPLPEPGPPSPPVDPRFAAIRARFGPMRFPLTPEATARQIRLLRQTVVDLAEALYSDHHQKGTK